MTFATYLDTIQRATRQIPAFFALDTCPGVPHQLDTWQSTITNNTVIVTVQRLTTDADGDHWHDVETLPAAALLPRIRQI